MTAVPYRQVRAVFDESLIRVYQAYSSAIADAALKAGTFMAPFKMERMTWVKPSFLWMMYRSGWASKPGQERVLGIDITREGFEWALAHACLSHYDHTVHESPEAWQAAVKRSPVRIQWDPERSIHLGPLDHRSIQIGLRGEAVRHYVRDWIVRIEDITTRCKEIADVVEQRRDAEALAMLPPEKPYPLPDELCSPIGAISREKGSQSSSS